MALKAVLENLDGVDEKFHGLYKLTEQGMYELQIEKDSIKSHSINAGLVSALHKERQAKKEFEDLAAKNSKIIEELGDVTKLRELKDKYDNSEVVPKEEVSKLVQMELQKIQAATNRERQEAAEALKEAQEQAAAAIRDKNNSVLTAALTQTLAKAGVQDYAMEDALSHSMKFWQVGEDGQFVAKDPSGITLPGEGEKSLTMDGWARRLEKAKPHYYRPATGGGASGLNGANPSAHLKELTGMDAVAEARKQQATA